MGTEEGRDAVAGPERERMLADARQRNERLAALVEIGRDLTSTLDIAEVLLRVVRDARRLLQGKVTSLMLERGGGSYANAAATDLFLDRKIRRAGPSAPCGRCRSPRAPAAWW